MRVDLPSKVRALGLPVLHVAPNTRQSEVALAHVA
jgi:hypothetical protein